MRGIFFQERLRRKRSSCALYEILGSDEKFLNEIFGIYFIIDFYSLKSKFDFEIQIIRFILSFIIYILMRIINLRKHRILFRKLIHNYIFAQIF